MSVELFVGRRVTAEVEGWSKARLNNALSEPDPSVPALDGVPRRVTGDLSRLEVSEPVNGVKYTKYRVAGHDVVPSSVRLVTS